MWQEKQKPLRLYGWHEVSQGEWEYVQREVVYGLDAQGVENYLTQSPLTQPGIQSFEDKAFIYEGFSYQTEYRLATYANVTITDFALGENDIEYVIQSAIPNQLSLQFNGFTYCSDIPNTAPVVQNQTILINEDTEANIYLLASDAESQPITYSIINQPLYGSLTALLTEGEGAYRYIPNPNFSGTDSITYIASDGQLSSALSTITVNVAPVNDAPVADSLNVNGTEDTAVTLVLSANDPEGSALSFEILTQPTHGTLSGTVPSLSYQPASQFAGSDSFTYRVNDGELDSNIATVTITIDAVNDAPIAVDLIVSTDENTPVGIQLSASDAEGDPLTYTLLSMPENGTLSGVGSQINYTPNNGFVGNDTFTYQASDTEANSNAASVTVVVNNLNDAPLAQDLTQTLQEDSSVAIQLSATDPDQDTLSFAIVTMPSNGNLTGDGVNWTYTPADNFSGLDSFTYRANDGVVDSNLATVTLTVSSVNDAPTANSINTSTDEDTSVAVALSGADIDGDALTYRLASTPSLGNLRGDAPNLIYTPNNNTTGTDRFDFVVNDGQVDSELATVVITITSINDAPVAQSVDITVSEDTPTAIGLVGTDSDGDALTYTLTTQPTQGTLTGTAPNLTYTPNSDVNGLDSFTFTVSDQQQTSNTATVSITIDSVNDAPVAQDVSIEITANQGVDIPLNASDADGDSLVYSITSQPQQGSVSISGVVASYTPNTNYSGEDGFTYIASDGTANSNPAMVTLTVTALPNNPPIITSSPSLEATENTPYQYAVEASDPDGDHLTYHLDLPANNFTISADAGVITGGNNLYVEGLRNQNVFCEAPSAPSSEITPVIKWQWSLTDEPQPSSRQVVSTPIVIPIEDTNGDGAIDNRDEKAIIFMTFEGAISGESGYLRAISAESGQHLWTVTAGNGISPTGQLAAGDINNDGFPEIIAPLDNRGVVALNHLGEYIWSFTGFPTSRTNSLGASIADLEGDGLVEVIVGNTILDSNGNLKYQGAGPRGENGLNSGYLSFAADIDLDGQQEIIAGGAIYSSTAELLVNNGEGYSAVGNFDDDDFAEIVVVNDANVSLYNHDGSVVWQNRPIPGDDIYGSYGGGPPVIGDVTGDGIPEIGVAGSTFYVVFNAAGEQLWASPIEDWSSGTTSSTIFDFNGDGYAEIVHADQLQLRVYNGETGDVLFSTPNSSGTILEHPIIADVDNDQHAELIVVGNNHAIPGFAGIRVFEDVNDSWASARSIMNQHAYSISNINDDMSIPIDPESSWLTHNTFRSNAVKGNPITTTPLADLALFNFNYDDQLESLSIDVSNRGLATATGDFLVEFYSGDSITGSKLGEAAISNVGVLNSQTVSIDNVAAGALGEFVSAKITPTGGALPTFSECITSNNVTQALVITVSVSDTFGASDRQTYLYSEANRNDQPIISSTSTSSVLETTSYSFTVSVTDEDIGDDHRFSLISAPENLFVNALTGEMTADANSLTPGTYTFTISVGDIEGSIVEQTHQLTVRPAGYENNQPEISSLPNVSGLVGQLYEYQVIANDGDGDSLTYSLINSPTGMSISTSGLVNWTPSTVIVVPVQIRVSDGIDFVDQSWSINVSQPIVNNPPSISSIPPSTVQLGQPYSYQIVANDPDGNPLTYSLLEAPTGMSLTTSGLISWTPANEGTTTVRVEVSDGFATSEQAWSVEVVRLNNPPSISSTPLTSLALGQNYNYQIIANDPDGDLLTYSLLEAPLGMSLSSTGLITWTPSAAIVTSIHIQVSDGTSTVEQSWSITVDSVNALPSISSTPTAVVRVGQQYSYQVIATDPDGDPLSYSLEQSPADMAISTEGLLTWIPSLAETVSVTARVSDGIGYTEQTWSLLSSDAVLAGVVQLSPKIVDEADTVSVRVIPQNAIAPVTVTATLDGNPIVLDANYQAQITATNIGVHTVQATITDQFETVIVSDTFIVRDPADAPPLVDLSQPLNNALVTSPISVTGLVNDANLTDWSLSYYKSKSQSSVTLAQGNNSVSEQTLATFDPTLLENGQYVIVLEGRDSAGQITQASRTVIVEGDLKVGHFSFSVEDLNVPLAGLPIRVTRTYDSRRRSNDLDFGYGWSVGYQDVTIEESRNPGAGWELNQYPSGPLGLVPNYCVEPISPTPVVSVTLPSGEVERFEVMASPECNQALPILFVQLAFRAIGDHQSTLEALDDVNGALVNGDLVLQDIPATVLNPNRYRLTTRDGYVYLINQDLGIETVTDPNGNTLTYSDNGIVHSTGKSVDFVRDAQGRITQVIDPAGNSINYAYNSNGDLSTVTERDGAVTTHTYYGSNCATPSATTDCHLLNDMLDPLGRRLVKNIYDESGRLIAQEDENGNRTEFNHDIAGRQSVVTDRNGNTTVFYYDDRGNVLSQVDALGNSKSFTYDASDNQLTQTDELGQTTTATFSADDDQLTHTDALGNTTTYAYNYRGQETEITDARGNTFINTYSNSGSLLSVEDPEGNIAGNDLNAQGLPTRIVDAEGNTTTYSYDSEGNKLTETDALNNVTTYTYDENNNVLTETRTRTVNGVSVSETTSYVYDERERVTATTDALGNTTRTEYNLLGQAIAQIDALNRRTEMDYDVYGNLLETRYPDGTSESHTYDPENNRLSTTDRLGRTTSFGYDALNRQISMTYPDGTSTQTEYDAAGRVTAEIDERGNRTEFEYDAANRRTATIDALGNRHEFNYDADGNLIDETDARNNTTTYTFNSLDQRTQTTFADNSTQSEVFDALGRRTAMTDQAGLTTHYAYDALGRLTTVTDVLGQATSYTYDEQGNKLTQTDAEGRTTTWTYDALGRVLTRTLPLGQVESFVYDANGNMTQKTDFNGAIHTYTYDINDRLIQTDYADGSQETITYDAVGNRLSATLSDSNGIRTWNYQYDSRNRLIEEIKPDGEILSYTYDAAGNRTELTTTMDDGSAGNAGAVYQYDALNRLSQVTDANNQTTQYGYDNVGNRSAVSYANGTVSTYSYDSLNRLTQLTTADGLGGTLQAFTYTLDPTGRRTQISEANGRVTDYVYDELYRLTRETITDSVNGNYSAEYQYDAVGNRIQSIIDGVTTAYTYDDNDRITQYGGTAYTYDANGNTLTETLDGVVKTYTYNSQNKLVSVDDGLDTTTYQYNIDGIRIQKASAGITTDYLVDHNRDYAQVLQERENGTEVVTYFYGDDLISQTRTGNTFVYHYDGLGSTRALSDATGSLTDTYDYEAFGETLNQTGSGTVNHYLFTGEQFDQNLNQYYLRARYYNQANGRFTQMDTWMGNNHDPITLHKYLYAGNDPVSYVDPTGNFFSLGGISAASRIRSTLAAVSTPSFSGFITAGVRGAIQLGGRVGTRLAARTLKQCIKKKNKCKLGLNLLIVGYNHPDMLSHIRHAQSRGRPFRLTHDRNKGRNTRWYARGGGQRGCENSKKSAGEQCDEYPMWKTKENKGNTATVSLRWVDGDENQQVGGYFGVLAKGMIKNKNPVFYVITTHALPTAALPLGKKK